MRENLARIRDHREAVDYSLRADTPPRLRPARTMKEEIAIGVFAGILFR
jgi:hypothetical protein